MAPLLFPLVVAHSHRALWLLDPLMRGKSTFESPSTRASQKMNVPAALPLTVSKAIEHGVSSPRYGSKLLQR